VSPTRFTLLVCSLLVLLCITSTAQYPSKSDGSSDATIVLTAHDKADASPINLGKEDLLVLEDGESRRIVAVEDHSSIPVSMTFLIDMSPSQAGSVQVNRAAAVALVNSALRPGKDMAAVYTFASELSRIQPRTSDLVTVKSTIQQLNYHSSPQNRKTGPVRTSIWDAVFAICNEPTQPSMRKIRKVIILMTDGMDNGSQKKNIDAIGSALRSNAIIYAFRFVWDQTDYGYGQEVLKEVSRQTGGRGFSPKNLRDLNSSVARVQKYLQSQFAITYSSLSKNSSHPYRKIEIKVVNAEKKKRLELLYPPRYYSGL
jgi:Ca-activated chloride channel homolog